MNTVKSIWAIRNIASGEYIKFGSKCAWATCGAAKAAFGLHMPRAHNQVDGFYQQRFDEQSEFEVVDLLGSFKYLQDAKKSADELADKLWLKIVNLEQEIRIIL
jgi:hypothetical protein